MVFPKSGQAPAQTEAVSTGSQRISLNLTLYQPYKYTTEPIV